MQNASFLHRIIGWRPRHPAQTIVFAFASAAGIGTVALASPLASATSTSTPILTAAFTAISAVCVTGLVVVDTGTHWSRFGQFVICALIQVGGLGIMTIVSTLALMFHRRFSVRESLSAAQSTGSLDSNDLKGILLRVTGFALVTEAIIALALFLSFLINHGYPIWRSFKYAIFLSISAFNNAGFAPWDSSLMRFSSSPGILIPIMIAIVIGGVGFPVLTELRRDGFRWNSFGINTRLAIVGTTLLLVIGSASLGFAEWNNNDTLGRMSWGEKLLNAIFASVTARTAGFNSIDVGSMHSISWLGNDILMFIGGGPGGTAGGIKVSTALVLIAIATTQVRGDVHVNLFGKQIPRRIQRQAISVVMLSVVAILTAVVILMAETSYKLDRVLFEVVSAFGTVGLSTGITAHLGPVSQVTLMVLMFLGRVGPISLVTALVLKSSKRVYELPQGYPLIG